jgi:hypothetical protein
MPVMPGCHAANAGNTFSGRIKIARWQSRLVGKGTA